MVFGDGGYLSQGLYNVIRSTCVSLGSRSFWFIALSFFCIL